MTHCTYPDCNCPFDAPADPNWCARGLPKSLEKVLTNLGYKQTFAVEMVELLKRQEILSLIPAVKALREENERLKDGDDSKHHLSRIIIEAKVGRLSVVSANGQAVPDGRYWFYGHPLTNIEENRLRKRIAALESQLAELRQGGEAMIQELRDLQSRIHFDPLPRFNVPDEIDRIIDNFRADADPQPAIPPGYVVVPLMPTRAMEDVVNQDEWQWEDLLAAAEAITEDQYNEIASAPAIQPAIPPGYVVVPVEPTRAMQDAWDTAGQHEDLDEEFAKAYRAMIAAAPSVPVAEKDVLRAALAKCWDMKVRYNKDNSVRELKLTFVDSVESGRGFQDRVAGLLASMLAAPADSKEGK